MTYTVKVKTKQKADSVEILSSSDKTVLIKTKSQPIDGKANAAIIVLLADFFKVTRQQVKILRGLSSRTKTVEIE